MPKTKISCPNCRQPIIADLEQLFDVGANPAAKQTILSGAFNIVTCQLCGYQGNVATPLVYHDPDKELLITYFPPEIGLPQNEQERLLGQLINQAVNRLPQEKRKGYLLRPQPVLTVQGLIDRILEAEGITREMIQAQQQRVGLIQRLLSIMDESVQVSVIQENDQLIDANFFALLQRLQEGALNASDEGTANLLAGVQSRVMEHSTYGRELKSQIGEVEAAITELRSLGRQLTREKLLDLAINAPNENRLQAYVSLARGGMDYAFFQLLSERIDKAREDGRNRLVELREQLLAYTRDFDAQLNQRLQQARQALENILSSEDISQAMEQALPEIDDFFLQALSQVAEEARKAGDVAKMEKLGQLMNFIQQVAKPPPELELIETLLQAGSEAEMRQILEANRDQVTSDFLNFLSGASAQALKGDDQEVSQKLQAINRLALRMSMEMQLRLQGRD